HAAEKDEHMDVNGVELGEEGRGVANRERALVVVKGVRRSLRFSSIFTTIYLTCTVNAHARYETGHATKWCCNLKATPLVSIAVITVWALRLSHSSFIHILCTQPSEDGPSLAPGS